jgi:predicted Fe-Mo cluster-binding NifX family protein
MIFLLYKYFLNFINDNINVLIINQVGEEKLELLENRIRLKINLQIIIKYNLSRSKKVFSIV